MPYNARRAEKQIMIWQHLSYGLTFSAYCMYREAPTQYAISSEEACTSLNYLVLLNYHLVALCQLFISPSDTHVCVQHCATVHAVQRELYSI